MNRRGFFGSVVAVAAWLLSWPGKRAKAESALQVRMTECSRGYGPIRLEGKICWQALAIFYPGDTVMCMSRINDVEQEHKGIVTGLYPHRTHRDGGGYLAYSVRTKLPGGSAEDEYLFGWQRLKLLRPVKPSQEYKDRNDHTGPWCTTEPWIDGGTDGVRAEGRESAERSCIGMRNPAGIREEVQQVIEEHGLCPDGVFREHDITVLEQHFEKLTGVKRSLITILDPLIA